MITISLTHIYKKFRIGFETRHSFLARILSLFSSREHTKEFTALDNISLNVSQGEILGIIGKNGSGKSTALRIMAGIYKPDAGHLQTHGRVISIINLGVGLMERLPMRDNIFLVGSLFGMNRKEITAQFDNIVSFSDLHEFVGTKIYQFSAGMIQRLAFSIAIHANPDILLLDEVFEVGDEEFKKKSSNKIKELAANGVTVVLVSHDIDIIKNNCTSIVEFEHGRIKRMCKPHDLSSTSSCADHSI